MTDALGTFYTSTISIPDGNYSISDMGDTLASLLSTELNTVPFMSGVTINWAFNTITNRFSLELIATYVVPFNLVFTNCPIVTAIGFTNYLDVAPPVIVANGPFVAGDYNVNMNPIPEIYVVSDALSDSNSFQCFPIGQSSVQTTASGIVAVVQLEHSSPYYVCKEFTRPTLIPLDRLIIDTIDFDLRDYNGNILYDFDQPWFITFSITEMNMDTARAQQLRTFINSVPPSIDQVNFLERNRINEETSQTLETLKQKLTDSLAQLRSNVQKRKTPSPDTTTILESTTGTNSTTYSSPTPSSANAGEAEQTSIDVDGSAKRQRQSQEISENINS